MSNFSTPLFESSSSSTSSSTTSSTSTSNLKLERELGLPVSTQAKQHQSEKQKRYLKEDELVCFKQALCLKQKGNVCLVDQHNYSGALVHFTQALLCIATIDVEINQCFWNDNEDETQQQEDKHQIKDVNSKSNSTASTTTTTTTTTKQHTTVDDVKTLTVDVYLNVAYIFLHLKDPQRATPYINQASRLSPERPRIVHRRGECAFLCGDFTSAVRYLKSVETHFGTQRSFVALLTEAQRRASPST